MTEGRHLVIRGVVQGVGFRYAMANKARQLGISGWVRNRRDGSVEAVIAGDPQAIAAMIAWSGQGPAGAAVDGVAVEWAEGEFAGFEQRSTA